MLIQDCRPCLQDAMMRQFQQEIARLQSELAVRAVVPPAGTPLAPTASLANGDSEVYLAAVKEAMRVELEAQLRQELTGDALAAARAESEATARQQVPPCRSSWLNGHRTSFTEGEASSLDLPKGSRVKFWPQACGAWLQVKL